MASRTVELFWLDEDEDKATTQVHILAVDADLDDLQALAVQTTLQDLSNASLYKWAIELDQQVAGAPAAAANTMSIADKAILLFKTAVGTVVSLSVPAPLVSIFTNDDVVNTGNALILAIKAAALAVLTDKAGNAVTDLISGYRDRRVRTRS